MKNTLRTVGFGLLFLISFVFFLYFTFPYEVLKETIGSELGTLTGYNISIGRLSSRFPVGLEAKNVDVSEVGGGASVRLSKLAARVSILSLLIGRLSLDVELQDRQIGTMDVDVTLSLFDLILKGTAFPSSLRLDAKDFSLSELVAFALISQSKSPTMNPLVAPILSKIGMNAKLNGFARFDFDPDKPADSTGNADIQLKEALLKLNDPSLALPDQKFSKAGIQAKLSSGILTLEKGSGLVSQDFSVGMDGKVSVKSPLSKSTIDLAINLSLKKALKEQFGFILEALIAGSRDGEANFKLTGTLSAPSMQSI